MSNESNNTSGIISNVWSYCNTLRYDGVGCGDYPEQLTYLLIPEDGRRVQQTAASPDRHKKPTQTG